MIQKRKIAVITGTRAEYGSFKPILKTISENPALELHLIVTGIHLSEEFGCTVKEIKKDGFKNSARSSTLRQRQTDKRQRF